MKRGRLAERGLGLIVTGEEPRADTLNSFKYLGQSCVHLLHVQLNKPHPDLAPSGPCFVFPGSAPAPCPCPCQALHLAPQTVLSSRSSLTHVWTRSHLQGKATATPQDSQARRAA